MTTAQDQQSRAEFEAIYRSDAFQAGIPYGSSKEVAYAVWQAARALPEGMEPVAWVEHDAGGVSYSVDHAAARKLPERVKHDLFTAAQVQAMGRVPETWAIYDSQGLYETRDTEAKCKQFCDHYNARDQKLGGGLAPYTYKALYAAAPRPPAAQERKPLTATSHAERYVNSHNGRAGAGEF